jgi:S-adenosylmethionine:tRNA-ribosyltransferase-isomerase (queuine synthetase)
MIKDYKYRGKCVIAVGINILRAFESAYNSNIF